MKKPNKLYKSLGPNTPMGRAFRTAHHHPVKSLRSGFRGVEMVIAGMFSGATLSKVWIQKFMATMSKMKVPYRGAKVSSLFSMAVGFGRKSAPYQGLRYE